MVLFENIPGRVVCITLMIGMLMHPWQFEAIILSLERIWADPKEEIILTVLRAFGVMQNIGYILTAEYLEKTSIFIWVKFAFGLTIGTKTFSL